MQQYIMNGNNSNNNTLKAKLLNFTDLIQEPSYPFADSSESEKSEAPIEAADKQAGHDVEYKSDCYLIQAFEDMSGLLTEQQSIIWQKWIQKVENTILNKEAENDLVKLVLLGQSLKSVLSANVNIKQRLWLAKIGSWEQCKNCCLYSTRQIE
uniref:Uncharacterized protein n=1 Tax=Ditylenchus dipsaci TaxID=166011 RepID=A0A915DPW4_9BILA